MKKCISLNARITLWSSSWEVNVSEAEADTCLLSHFQHMLIVWKGEHLNYLCYKLVLPPTNSLLHIPELRSQS